MAGGAEPSGTQPPPQRPPYLSALLALALGVLLSLAVSSAFTALGWGGELASQTAGAASGTAPLILDGLRYSRSQRNRWPLLPDVRRGGYRRKLWLVSCFGFALLLVDTAAGFCLYQLTRGVLRLARADPGRFPAVYGLIGGTVTIPLILVSTYLLALAAGHRLGERSRRWLLLGFAIYALVRIGNIVTASPTVGFSLTGANLVVGLLVTLPLLIGCGLLGARRARQTQDRYEAARIFRRLSPPDREAALALLDDSAPAPSRVDLPVPPTPRVAPRGSGVPER